MKTREEIYREVLHEYHVEDAVSQVEQYLDYFTEVDPKTFDGVFDYDYLATIFEENHDCNIADNVQWLEIIETYIRENDIILEP